MTKFNVNTKIVIIITIGFLVIGNVAISTNIIDLKDLSEKKTDEFQTGCSETIQCSMNEPKGRIDQEKNLNYAIQTSSTIIEDSDEFLEGSLVNLTLDENAHLSLDKIVGVDDWKIMTSSGPSARAYSAMTYDSTIGKIILFGGIYGGTQIYDDTWVYDLISNTWTQMNPSTKPPARCYHSMAFDSSSGKVILFGGRGGPTLYLSDTWVYDLNSNSWTQMTPSTHPSGRAGYSMVYDITSNKVILFGGSRDYTYYADTWAYDLASNSWTQMTPSIKPSARSFYSMAYDSISDKVILFGGAGGGKINDETWIYDYDFNTWTLKAPSIKPKARCYHSMTFNFDSSVLFGGWDFSSHLSDTWLYDLPTDTWTQMAPPTIPKARWGHSMVSDSAFDKVILFGGYFSSGWGADHTWIYPVNKQYYQSGLFESRITYLGNTYEISGDITWSPSVQPENTSLKLQIGFSNTTLAEDFHYTDYHTSDFSFTGYTQYLRYRAIFDTNMTLFLSPTLESVTIYYSWETTLNTIPNAPQDLSAIADENFIELNWTAPSDDGGSVVTRYNVYRGTESGEYIFLGLTPKTNFTDSAVEGGTMYYYVITAVNIIGESPFSQEVSVLSSGTPEIPTTVPSAPQNLSATTKFKFIELNWTAPNDNGGSIIMSYRIYRGTSSGVYLLIGIVVAPTTSYNDTLILSKTTYFYAVTAINALGESVFSDEVSATSKRSKITPFPDFPTILIFLGVSVMLIRKFKKK